MINYSKGDKIKLSNKYVIEKKIGDGGFGSVYKAIESRAKKPVAIKIYKPEAFNTSAEARMYWQRESDLTQATEGYPKKHMEFIEAFEDKSDRQNPNYFLVLGFIDNATTLKSWFNDNLRSSTPLGINQMVEKIFLPICEFMFHAQKHGAIHRDFTFNNIMIIQENSTPVPIVIDWGGGRKFDAKTLFDEPPLIEEMKGSGTVIITPGFFAPEIIMQKPPLPQTDIYMFGAVLFYALTNGYTRVKPTINSDYILHPQDYNMNISDTLNDIVEKCTQYEPRERFRSFNDVKQALGQYLGGKTDGLAELPSIETENSFALHILNNNAIISLNPYEMELERQQNMRIGREVIIESAPWKETYKGVFRGITRAYNQGKPRSREQFFLGYSNVKNIFYIYEGRNSNPTLLDGKPIPPNQWIPITVGQKINVSSTTVRGVFELISVLDLED